jgi:hypothetical protein
MGLKIFDRLDFAIGRDQAADGTAINRSGAHTQRPLARENWNKSQQSESAQCDPRTALARGWLPIRMIRIMICRQWIIFGAYEDACQPLI